MPVNDKIWKCVWSPISLIRNYQSEFQYEFETELKIKFEVKFKLKSE